MALTYSSMLDLQTDLIPFSLLNTATNQTFSSEDLDLTKPTLIMFICNHCPYVIHYHQEIKKLATDYLHFINIVAISSNDITTHPEDSPEKMRNLWSDLGLRFPYLYDESQELAKKYQAECTPEFYLFDLNRKLVYRGRMDGSSPGSDTKPSAKDLRLAIDNLLANKKILEEQFPSMGCNIKWKSN